MPGSPPSRINPDEQDMSKTLKRTRSKGWVIIAVSCLLSTFPVFAQQGTSEADRLTPTFIQSPRIVPATPDRPLTITAYVTDNVGVRSVSVYYRFGSIAPYFQLGNDRTYKKRFLILTSDGDYTAEIPRDQVTGNILEYYIEAGDWAGNTVSKGFPDKPFTVTFVASQVSNQISSSYSPESPGEPLLIPMGAKQPMKTFTPEQPAPEDDSDNKAVAWYENRLLWAVVGGIVFAAALSGGGGGNGSSTGSVTINAPPPQ